LRISERETSFLKQFVPASTCPFGINARTHSVVVDLFANSPLIDPFVMQFALPFFGRGKLDGQAVPERQRSSRLVLLVWPLSFKLYMRLPRGVKDQFPAAPGPGKGFLQWNLVAAKKCVHCLEQASLARIVFADQHMNRRQRQ